MAVIGGTEIVASFGSGFAPLASPQFTGVPTAPTAAPGTNTTQLATTAFVTAAVLVETTRALAAEAALPQRIASGTATLTANGALAAATSQAVITVAGAGILTTDTIEWSYATAPTTGDSLCHLSPYVTAGNVNFVRTNSSASTPAVTALVVNWRVIR